MVKGVRRRDGSLIDLPMKMISFVPVNGQTYAPSGEPLDSNVAYVFHVNGEYVSNTWEVTSHFWKASYRYAYHCKIEVTPLSTRPETRPTCSPALRLKPRRSSGTSSGTRCREYSKHVCRTLFILTGSGTPTGGSPQAKVSCMARRVNTKFVVIRRRRDRRGRAWHWGP